MTPETREVFRLFQHTKDNFLVIGQAGTGKSFLLQMMASTLLPSKFAVVAPTGMAALNCEGSTIHGFFHLPVDKYPFGIIERNGEWWKRLKNDGGFAALETLFVDEISMVRADVLDALDHVLRVQGPDSAQPFGGVRIIAFGDPLQLPPVEKEDHRPWFRGGSQKVWHSPWFFDAKAWVEARFKIIELNHNYRQNEDEEYAQFLRFTRIGDLIPQHNEMIMSLQRELPDQHIALRVMCTNKQVNEFNDQKICALPNEEWRSIADERMWAGDLPVERDIRIKVGARVMLRANLDVGANWVNGTLGHVLDIDREGARVLMENDAKEQRYISRYTWTRELTKKRGLQPPKEATFSQIPLTLAWAITIHKMQGQTAAGSIVLEADNAFVGGQVYVGLSRVRTRKQICIPRPLSRCLYPERHAYKFLKTVLPATYWY